MWGALTWWQGGLQPPPPALRSRNSEVTGYRPPQTLSDVQVGGCRLSLQPERERDSRDSQEVGQHVAPTGADHRRSSTPGDSPGRFAGDRGPARVTHAQSTQPGSRSGRIADGGCAGQGEAGAGGRRVCCRGDRRVLSRTGTSHAHPDRPLVVKRRHHCGRRCLWGRRVGAHRASACGLTTARASGTASKPKV